MMRKTQSLVRRFKEGDEKAFNQLLRLYQKKIYDLTYRIVRGPKFPSHQQPEFPPHGNGPGF